MIGGPAAKAAEAAAYYDMNGNPGKQESIYFAGKTHNPKGEVYEVAVLVRRTGTSSIRTRTPSPDEVVEKPRTRNRKRNRK